MDTDDRVQAVLAQFENSGRPFTEVSLLSALNALARKIRESGEDFPSCLSAEGLAFHLVENCLEREVTWGTYHGPMAIGQDAEGNRVDTPSLDSVSAEVVEYWEQRAFSARHPILRARYADLVWDFKLRAAGTRAPVEMAHIAIDNNLVIIQQSLHASKGMVPVKLRRALSLALSINDTQRIQIVRHVILAARRDAYWHMWRLIYDELLKNGRAGLTDAERQELIRGIEEELGRELQTNKPNLTQIENLTLWLADYYRPTRDNEMRRVVGAYASFVHTILDSSPGLTASGHLERLHEIYLRYNLTQEAQALTQRLEEMGDRALNDMQTVSHSMNIPKEEMDRYLDALTNGTIEGALTRIAIQFSEDPVEVRNILDRLAAVAPFQFLFTKKIQNPDGITIAHVGPLEDDMDGNIVYQMAQGMALSGVFLRAAMEHMTRKFGVTAEAMCQHLYGSPVFVEHHRALIQRGLRAYLEGEFDVCIHMLIPQIEQVVRRLAQMCGAHVYRTGRRGGFQVRNLDELLRDECVVSSLGERFTIYLASLLTDQRGWNLRNNVCHGISPSDQFTVGIADRIIHALLVLGLLRQRPTSQAQPSESQPDIM